MTGLSLMGSLVAFALDAAIAAIFGAGAKLDAYLTAMVIPAILATTVPSTVALVFVPVFHHLRAEEGEARAWLEASRMFGLVSALLGVAVAPLYAFAPRVVLALAPGFDAATAATGTILLRWLLCGALLIGVASFMSGILNANDRFVPPAFASLLQSLVMLAVVALLAPRLGGVSLGVGYFCGAVIQFAFLLAVLIRSGRLRLALDYRSTGVVETLHLAAVLLLSGIAYNALALSDRYFGSQLPRGTITSLAYGIRAGSFIANLLGAGVAAVAFTRLSALSAEGRRAEAGQSTFRIMSLLTLAIVPPLGVVFGLREPVLSALFERKAFTHAAVLDVADAMIAYSGTILVLGLGRPLSLLLFSLRDTRTSLAINCGALVLHVGLSFVLLRMFSLGGLGLALSNSVVHAASFTAYLMVLAARIPGLPWRPWLSYLARIIVLSSLAYAACRCAPALLAHVPPTVSPWPFRLGLAVYGAAALAGVVGVLYLVRDSVLFDAVATLRRAPRVSPSR